MKCDPFSDKRFPWWKTEITQTHEFFVIIYCKKCLLAWRSLKSCSHEAFVSPCEGNLKTFINVVCISRNHVQLLQSCFCGIGQKNTTEILVGSKFSFPYEFLPLWVFWQQLESVGSTAGEHLWGSLILVKIIVCAESRFYLYTREIRRNLNTNLQVPGICWSQISLLKRSKMLNSKRRSHFSIARAVNLGGSCSKMPGVNTASVNQLSRWNPCFHQKHHLKLPQRSVLCAGKVEKFARYTR